LAIVAVVVGMVAHRGGSPGARSGSAAALANYVARVDPASRRVTRRIRVGKDPVGVAIGEGSVWVVNGGDDTVSRIDPVSGKVTATIHVGKGANSIAFGEGAVWVANWSERSISRIDPADDKVSTISVDDPPLAIAVGDGDLWVIGGNPGGRGTLRELDANTHGSMWESSLPFGPAPGPGTFGMGEGKGSIWIGNPSGVLLKYAAQTGALLQELDLGKRITAILVREETVWVGENGSPGTVVGVDVSSVKVRESIPAGGGSDGQPAPPLAMAGDEQSLWVTDGVNSTITRILVVTGQAPDLPTEVGGRPNAIAVGLGSVWVTVDGR
jgi:YVTN family beta-propeller protein